MSRSPRLPLAALAVVSTLAAAPAARAQTVPFGGTFTGVVGAPDPTGRCPAPQLTFELTPTGVIAPFGFATTVQSHCVNPPSLDFTDGLFTFDFGGGNTFSGTYWGMLVPAAPPVFDVTGGATITGGTGIFAGAIGGGTSTGTQDLATGAFQVQLTGTVTAPGLSAVPEPSTVALLGGGLAGLAGVVQRRRGRAR